MSEPFDFLATVEKVQTMADGGIRVTLDMPAESEIAAAKLMAVRRLQMVLVVTAEAVDMDEPDEKPVQNGSTNGREQANPGTTRSPIDMAGC